MKQRLNMQVATAVGAMLVDRDTITLEDVATALPAHLRAANPSLKLLARTLVDAGWAGERRDGGAVVYTSPLMARDALEPGEALQANGVAGDEVRLLIERAERLEEERKGLTDDIKDVWAEAKSRGHDVKSMKAIMRIRRKPREEQQEEQALLEVYMRSLGMM